MTSRTCTKCKVEKPTGEFYWQTSRHGKRYQRAMCKSCEWAAQRLRNAAKDPAVRAERQRFSSVKCKYNLSEDQFRQLLARQDSKCAICFEQLMVMYSCVDHDHGCCKGERSCGECVRGILCRACNTGIGKFKEDVTVVERAVRYMKGELS